MDCKRFIDIVNNLNCRAAIYGAGKYGSTWCYELLMDAGVSLAFYIDNFKMGDTCNGLPVYSLETLKHEQDVFVFISTCGEVEDDMEKSLLDIGKDDYFRFESEYAPAELARYLDELNDEKLICRFSSVTDDKRYLKTRFRMRMGYEPDLENPRTFNEKLNWLKLYDRNPLYTTLVDKYAVKEYVSEIIGKEHVVPTIGVWDSFDDVDFDELPKKFVLKCTHDSGSIIICKNKEKFNVSRAKKKISSALKKNYFFQDREWPYKDVPRKIMAEQFIESDSEILDVYKIFNFMGKPEIIQMIQNDKTENETIDYFDTKWNLLDLRQNFPNSPKHRQKPRKLEEMLRMAEELSKGIPFVRTDFYIDGDRILFSEYTFFSDSGCERFYPESYDKTLGDKILI